MPVPGIANSDELGVRRGRFALSSRMLRPIFDAYLDPVLVIVEKQLQSLRTVGVKLDSIVLLALDLDSGITNVLDLALSDMEILRSQRIPVFQIPDGATAAARGAVMMGLADIEAGKQQIQ